MKEDLESPLPIVIIKECLSIAMEITIRLRLLADSYSLFVICLPRASPRCFHPAKRDLTASTCNALTRLSTY